MEQLYIEVIKVILHFTAVLYCIVAVFKRWGYYWVLPALSSLSLFIVAFRSAYLSSTQEIILTGSDLFYSLTSASGALFWLLSIVILHIILIHKKKKQTAKTIFLGNAQPAVYPVHPKNTSTSQSLKEETNRDKQD
ncbi:MAG: hypothetical protein KAQ69_09720 [Spirochaetales bacterium]|nr:hypothetical protein [Spirochaetales bacterium]